MSKLQLSPRGTVFDLAWEALAAAGKFDTTTREQCQYEVMPVFGAPDRAVIGFVARVKDLDGFGLGYVFDPAMPNRTGAGA